VGVPEEDVRFSSGGGNWWECLRKRAEEDGEEVRCLM